MNQKLKPLNWILKPRGKFLDINFGYDFYGHDTKNTNNKSKNQPSGLYQT